MDSEPEVRDYGPPNSFSVEDEEEAGAVEPYVFESFPPECGLCLLKRKTLYCGGCASKGDFIHSGRCRRAPDGSIRVRPGTLAEKRCEETAMRRRLDQLRDVIRRRESARFLKAETREEMAQCRQRIRHLRRLVGDAQQSLSRTKEASLKLQSVNERRNLRLPLFVDKVDKISRCVGQYGADMREEKRKVDLKARELSQLRNRHTQLLMSVLFPVQAVATPRPPPQKTVEGASGYFDPNLDFDGGGESAAISEVMADAMSMSFIQGRWVTTSASSASRTDDEYQIAGGPAVPSNGDCSALPALVSAVSQSEDAAAAVAAISAALTYAAQLVSQLYAVWDEVPPKRLSFWEFGVPTSSRYLFAKNVARLNLNVIYLCLRLGVDAEDVGATRTLGNLRLLAGRRALGAPSPSFRPDSYLRLSVENFEAELAKVSPTTEDLAQEGSEDEDCGWHEDDWEAVSPEGGEAAMLANVHPEAASSATSFVTSWIRGFATGGN